MSVAVGKLPMWCFSGDYALMGHTRELSQQLLNEPFNEVKAQMVRFCTMDGRTRVIVSFVGRRYSFTVIGR
jgi:hypothetical protein